jgi:hypothetical protein
MIQSSDSPETAKLPLWELFSELFAPILRYLGASSHNATLARRDMPIAGENFTLCDVLVAPERWLDS